MSPDSVRRLQALLNTVLNPSPRLVVDGIFGPRTRAALHRLQAARDTIPSSSVHKMVTATPPVSSASTVDVDNEADKWMKIAEQELGQAEISGTAANSRIIEYQTATSYPTQSDETPWCSSFVNWVMKQANVSGTNNAAAKSWLGWGKTTEPRYGAVTVVRLKSAMADAAAGTATGYHVAFFVAKDATHLELLGGNQSDMVKKSRFKLASWNIEGYRWPG